MEAHLRSGTLCSHIYSNRTWWTAKEGPDQTHHPSHLLSSQFCTFVGHSRREVDFTISPSIPSPSPNFPLCHETSPVQTLQRCSLCLACELESCVFICKEWHGCLVKLRTDCPKQILVYRTLSNCITFPLIKFSSLLPKQRETFYGSPLKMIWQEADSTIRNLIPLIEKAALADLIL